MRRATLMVAAVAALVVASGCVGSLTGDSSGGQGQGLSADEIRQKSIEASKKINTAKYHMEMDVSADNGDISMSADGQIDKKNKKQKIDMQMTMKARGNSRSMNVVSYIDGDTMYMNLQGMWRTQPVPNDNMWKSGTQIGSQKELLKAVSVSKAGSATVEGTDTYVLKLKADDKQAFREAMSSQLSQQGNQQGLQFLKNSEIKNFDAKLYVAKDTKYVRKMKMDMSLKSQGQTMDLSLTMTFTEINGDVSITIPQEAKKRLQAQANAPA